MPTPVLALALFSAFVVAVLSCVEAGRRTGRRAFVRGAVHPAGLGTVETVAFGLLALLLAFTFSGAAERFDRRRAQAVEEANDIGTAWLRLDLLPAAAQPKLRDAFRRYTDSRIQTYRVFSESGLAAAHEEYARSVALQNEIWSDAVAACREAPSQASIVLLPALNAMIDITTTRLSATRTHPPRIVFIVLGLISLACALLVGYEMGASETRSWAHIVVLALLLSAMLYVILDFEYPRLGLIRVDDFDVYILQVRASMK